MLLISEKYHLTLLILLFALLFSSCKIAHVKILEFVATPIYPGRAEQNKYTSYTLKLLNQEKSIKPSTFRITLNNDFTITPIILKNHTANIFAKNDTILLSFSVQNKFNPDHKFKLTYHNTKTTKTKKLKQLSIKQNTPPIN
jgi:hypothetical protein